ESGVERFVDLVVSPRLDPLAHSAEILEIHEEAGVILDERALLGDTDADCADQIRWVGAYLCGEIVEQPLPVLEVRRIAHVDEYAEVRQPGHPLAELLDRDDARSLAGQELVELAAEVHIEERRPERGRDREERSDDPEQPAMTQRPGHERPRPLARPSP